MKLRRRLRDERILVVPGVYDAMSALLVRDAGFEAAYLSGASLAYTRFARPDIGFLSLNDVAEVVGNISERVNLPLIVDADTGFGNALNVARTMWVLERAGAAAVQFEDQTMPKRCGHLDSKTLVSTVQMMGKIRAAVDARRSEEVLVVARTDAVAVEGLESALERAERYAEAGADVLFVEALRTEVDMHRATRRLAAHAPMLSNMVEGGKTPLLNAHDLQRLGYRIVIFPGGTVRALAHALQAYLRSLYDHGTTAPFVDRMLDFRSLNELIGTPEMLDRGRAYDSGDA